MIKYIFTIQKTSEGLCLDMNLLEEDQETAAKQELIIFERCMESIIHMIQENTENSTLIKGKGIDAMARNMMNKFEEES